MVLGTLSFMVIAILVQADDNVTDVTTQNDTFTDESTTMPQHTRTIGETIEEFSGFTVTAVILIIISIILTIVIISTLAMQYVHRKRLQELRRSSKLRHELQIETNPKGCRTSGDSSGKKANKSSRSGSSASVVPQSIPVGGFCDLAYDGPMMMEEGVTKTEDGLMVDTQKNTVSYDVTTADETPSQKDDVAADAFVEGVPNEAYDDDPETSVDASKTTSNEKNEVEDGIVAAAAPVETVAEIHQ